MSDLPANFSEFVQVMAAAGALPELACGLAAEGRTAALEALICRYGVEALLKPSPQKELAGHYADPVEAALVNGHDALALRLIEQGVLPRLLQDHATPRVENFPALCALLTTHPSDQGVAALVRAGAVPKHISFDRAPVVERWADGRRRCQLRNPLLPRYRARATVEPGVAAGAFVVNSFFTACAAMEFRASVAELLRVDPNFANENSFQQMIGAGLPLSAFEHVLQEAPAASVALLQAAIAKDRGDLLDLAIASGASVSENLYVWETKSWSPPLMLATSVAMLQCLVGQGADVNARNDAGLTPLMVWAKKEANLPLVRAVLDLGADPSLTHEGRTVLQIAASASPEMRRTLRAARAQAQLAGEVAVDEAQPVAPGKRTKGLVL